MHPIPPFAIARLPEILFGPGSLMQLPERARQWGQRALLVTGQQSFLASPWWPALESAFAEARISLERYSVAGEPSPDLVDQAVTRFRGQGIEMVIGIGGGSALDAAKAIAGLLPTGASVMDFLEGVGRGKPYAGPALPLLAVPTTAGTGSEATKNAVLSHHGKAGFKKSFRDERLVPRLAVIDPRLLQACPRAQLAANAMDSFTQLLEAYTSTRANPFTDALAWSGLQAWNQGIWPALDGSGEEQLQALGQLHYAALLSGICLAQTGLGAVHGLAAPLGAFYPIPHGEVCGTLVAEATAINIEALRQRAEDGAALDKYAQVGALLLGEGSGDGEQVLSHLLEALRGWVDQLQMPRLSGYGLSESGLAQVAAQARGNSMRTNPIELSDAELVEILRRRL